LTVDHYDSRRQRLVRPASFIVGVALEDPGVEGEPAAIG
jgi:hypothetical protein